jgi:hypothetical protein
MSGLLVDSNVLLDVFEDDPPYGRNGPRRCSNTIALLTSSASIPSSMPKFP